MKILNKDFLDKLVKEKQDFHNTKPFPFINANGFLKGFRTKLIDEYPKLGDMYRGEGNGVVKVYSTDIDRLLNEINFSQTWIDFMEDLLSREYKQFMADLADVNDFKILFEFAVGQDGYWLGAHPDTPRKKCVNLFYMNDSRDWKPEWGGRTIIMEDYSGKKIEKQIPPEQTIAPKIFAENIESDGLIFKRSDYSWHGVETVTCPNPGFNRKVFIANVYDPSAEEWYTSSKLEEQANR